MRILPILMVLAAFPLVAQVNRGEVQLSITDPSGAALRASVQLASSGNGYAKSFRCDAHGQLTIQLLPYGAYELRVTQPGFAALDETIAINSAMPRVERIQLKLAPVESQVKVTSSGTMVDPYATSSVMQIGTAQIQQRLSSLPGRSVQDLTVSQPGWLYEGSTVLHPRGSEYQTLFVVDGIPLIDNRSPGLGPEIEADDLDSMSIYTAGFPAEYGRALGGVVELNTRRDSEPGFHGDLVVGGGSYDTLSGFGQAQEMHGKNTFGLTAAGSTTDHYLNPVVPQNYTNTGTTGGFSARYERDSKAGDRLILRARHELSHFLIPNEQVQEDAGQIQDGDNFETMGSASYQHLISTESLLTLAGMGRSNGNDRVSNRNPTPIAVLQHNTFGEAYFRAGYALHQGHQEFKAGVDSDNLFLHEHFDYIITNPGQFSSDTPAALSFAAERPALQQSAFIEDLVHVANWTVNAGLRWDHYQLLFNQNAFSPRLSAARYLPSLRATVHGAYDSIFQTPSYENILISSSAQIEALSSQFLRLPVRPSTGSYFEGGWTQGLLDRMRIDVNLYRRDLRKFADDDQLLNTGVSYPISFDKAVIYGGEGKVEIVRLQNLSGFASYSYMVGNAWLPVTGGLFLGDEATNAVKQLAGHLPASQDQRHTVNMRLHYGDATRAWIAGGMMYGSGLPFRYTGSEAEALAQYGESVISRLDFARGRVKPNLAADASIGLHLCECGGWKTTLQADGENLNNRLNVLDFGGLFSGNAIAPGRNFMLRLNTHF